MIKSLLYLASSCCPCGVSLLNDGLFDVDIWMLYICHDLIKIEVIDNYVHLFFTV